MSSEERNKWEEVARKDKERYKIEMAIYSGPSTLPKLGGKRYKKDKSAPKRPMSAYLDYSKTYRSQVIRDYPHVIDNREISKILGIMWKNATEEEKAPFVSKEKILRAQYNRDIERWRKVHNDRIKAHRAMREEIVHHAIESGTSDQLIEIAKQYQNSAAALQTNPMQSQMHTNWSSGTDCTEASQERCSPASSNQIYVSGNIPADHANMFGYNPLDNTFGMSLVYNQNPLIISVVHPCQQSGGILRPLDHPQANITEMYSHPNSHSVENLAGVYRDLKYMVPQARMRPMGSNLNAYAFGSLLTRGHNHNSHNIYYDPSNKSFFTLAMDAYL